LANFLNPHAAGGLVPCVVETRVFKPNDVFDRYGRMVADVILIKKNHERKSVGEWLVENGWAYNTVYDSMFADQLRSLLAAEKQAGKAGINARYDDRVRSIDFKLIERSKFKGKPDAPVAGQRDSRVVLPKLFRRLTTWSVKTRLHLLSGSFPAFVQSQSKTAGKHKKGDCYRTKDFLAKGKNAKRLWFSSLISTTRISARP